MLLLASILYNRDSETVFSPHIKDAYTLVMFHFAAIRFTVDIFPSTPVRCNIQEKTLLATVVFIKILAFSLSFLLYV